MKTALVCTAIVRLRRTRRAHAGAASMRVPRTWRLPWARMVVQTVEIERLARLLAPGHEALVQGAAGNEKRHALRANVSRPIIDRIKEFAETTVVVPGSGLDKAIQYMVGMWSGLTRFLVDPRISLGRVERWRGGRRTRGVAVSGCFRVRRRCLNPCRDSVSSARSSN
ncbi:transposase, partial [Polyangium sp. 15x6]|uniref:IS66 family transposase n=1 Tax=Polyangium sp. 15x6 TaxID=3042687 RepID=UPI00249C4F42